MHEIRFFPYFGPSRRSDRRVVEIGLTYADEQASSAPWQVSDIRKVLRGAGVLERTDRYPEQTLPEDRREWFSSLLAQTALLFQRKCGHRVDFFSILTNANGSRHTVLVEHEHTRVGTGAVKLALELFASRSGQSFASAWQAYAAFARKHVLPLETAAIIDSAQKRGIPCFQLEREPLTEWPQPGFRVRPNGYLILGHGQHRRLLDGTLCVDRAGERVSDLLRSARQRLSLLERLGYPLAGEGGKRTPGERPFHLLAINGNVTGLQQLGRGSTRLIANVHPSYAALCEAISKETGGVPFAVKLQARGLANGALGDGAVLQDVDFAPDLGKLFGHCNGGENLLATAADDLLDWLFPDGAPVRMPIITVTGTNGKTTTVHMIEHVMRAAGRKPGLVCTDGTHVNGRRVSDRDASAFIGHASVLTSDEVDTAVLEAHHLGMAQRGFAFDYCDVAVCLNVTDDHLGAANIDTVEQMAEVKRSLLERARHGVVVNADNPLSLGMLTQVQAQKHGLVSTQTGIAQLREHSLNADSCFAVIEAVEDQNWLVLYDSDQRLPLIPEKRIPATFDGHARFNTANALHAAAACFLAGIDVGQIGAALATFACGYETVRGRMNSFDGLPFRVIMDYAHNGDGFEKISAYVSSQSVPGRKIVMFAYHGDRRNVAIEAAARQLAGHYDHYVCRNYRELRSHRAVAEIPELLRASLVAAGVPDTAVSIIPDAHEAVRKTLAMASEGDLVVLLVGAADFEPVWNLLKELAAPADRPPS